MNHKQTFSCRPSVVGLLLLLTLLFHATSHAQRGCSGDPADLHYQANIRFQLLDHSANMVTFEVTNANTDAPTDCQSRVSASRWLVIPPGGQVTYETLEAEWVVYWEDGTIEGPLSLNEEASSGALPSTLRRIAGSPVGIFRSVGLAQSRATLTAGVTRNAPSFRRGTAVVQRFVAQATISGASLDQPAYPENLAEKDPFLLQVLEPLVINAEHIAAFTRANPEPEYEREVREWNTLLADGTSRGPVLLSRVPEPGVYHITPQMLADAGVPVGSAFYERMRFRVGDKVLPVLRLPSPFGPFAGADTLAVYVPPIRTHRYPYIPLWLFVDDPDDPELLREARPREVVLDEVESAPEEEAAPAEQQTPRMMARVEILEPREYDRNNFPFTARTGHWATSVCVMGRFVDHEFHVSGLDRENPAEVFVTFGGTSNSRRQQSRIYINGQPVSDLETTTGRGPFERRYTIPAGLLQEGGNVFSLEYPQVRDRMFESRMVFSFAEVSYPVDPQRFPANRPVTLTGPPGTSLTVAVERDGERFAQHPLLADITDPEDPQMVAMRSSRSTHGAAAYLATLQIGNAPAELIYTDENVGRRLARLERYEHRDLIEPSEGADYLIVTAPELQWGVDELIQARERDGYRVKVLTTDEIYAAFMHGERDYVPIHRLVRHAFNNWPGERLQHVLLVGEASEYWWERRHRRDDVSPNLVPVYGFADPSVSVRSDDSYGIVSGESGLSDVSVGRISALEPEDVATVARMIWEYENNTPAGPWATRHAFYTDDERAFRGHAERIIASEVIGHGRAAAYHLDDFPYEDYFRIVARKRSTAMTNAIIESLSRGALTATYIGHGGPNLWSSSRMFHYRDIPLVNNQGRRPILIAGSCDTAWIDYPIHPVRQSLGEQFLLDPNGGAIAVFAPIAATSAFEHDFLLRHFMAGVNNPEVETVGHAAIRSRLQYMLDRNQRFVSNQYVLLGDPALRIPRVSDAMEVEITPTELFSDQQSPIIVEGSVELVEWGLVEAVLIDGVGNDIAGPVRGRVANNRFRVELPTPPFMQPGPHRLVVDAWSEGRGRHVHRDIAVEVRTPQVELVWTSEPSVETAVNAGQLVEVSLTARNLSEGYMDDLLLHIRDVARGTELTSQPLTLGGGDERNWRFGLNAPAGVTMFEARVEYAQTPAAERLVAESRLEMRALAPNAPPLSVPERLVEVRRLASPDETIFDVPIYNMTPEPIADLEVDFVLLDSEAGSPVGLTRQSLQIGPAESTTVRFRESTRFPEGRLPFALRVRERSGRNPGAQLAEIPLPLHIEGGEDVEVVPGSVRTERDSYVRSETVYVTADIRNRGTQPVEELRTTLYVDFPWNPDNVADAVNGKQEVVFDRPLLPGETRPVRLRWDPRTQSELNVRLYVVTNSDRRLPESDFSNNVGDVAVSMLRLPNLALVMDEVEVSQRYVRKGEVINVTVPFVNDSPFDFAHHFVTEVRAHGEGYDPALLYRLTTDGLSAGEEGLLQTSWVADGLRDVIVISLNDDRDYGEAKLEDNVMRVPLTYLVNTRRLRRPDGAIRLSSSFIQGDRRSVALGADRSLVLRQFPEGGSTHPFRPENLLGDPLPDTVREAEQRGVMAIIDDALIWNETVLPDPVRFRFHLPDEGRATLYDIFVDQLNPPLYPGQTINRFQYRFNEDRSFQPSQEWNATEAYLGRVETGDHTLEIEIGPTETHSRNSLFHLRAVPISGTFHSPIYEIDGMPSMVFLPEESTPGETRIEYELRASITSHVEPEFTEWIRLRPGDRIAADPDVRIFQLRVFLIGDRENIPTVHEIVFDPNGVEGVAAAGK